MESQDLGGAEVARASDGLEPGIEIPKDFGEPGGYDEIYEDDDGSNNFRGNRGRGNFRFVLHVSIFSAIDVNFVPMVHLIPITILCLVLEIRSKLNISRLHIRF